MTVVSVVFMFLTFLDMFIRAVLSCYNTLLLHGTAL